MRLHLVDGTFELFRAHFSQRPSRSDSDGRDVKATVGLAASLLALLEDADEDVTHIAAAFDNPIRSFRNDLFAPYKDDSTVPDELRAQFDRAEEAARALGLVVWSMDEYEADDALATAARRWRDDVEQVRIMTPDKDLGQCLEGSRVVLVDRMRERVIDEAAQRERRGVGPESIPDYLALVGDSADGIPGLPGFGEKTAAALLERYVHVDAIPEGSWDVRVRGEQRLTTTLSEHRDEVALYVRLATLVDDVALPEKLTDLAWEGVPRDAFHAWCERIGATALAERPRRWRE